MAEYEGIDRFQSFTERTLKYGRNLMVSAVPPIVFHNVPAIDLAKSRPFNFEIAAGGEAWVWYLLTAVLVYYAIRFFGLALPDYRHWKDQFDVKRNYHNKVVANERNKLRAETESLQRQISRQPDPPLPERTPPETNVVAQKDRYDQALRSRREYRWQRNYFWLTDFTMPTALFLWALYCCVVQIYGLLVIDS